MDDDVAGLLAGLSDDENGAEVEDTPDHSKAKLSSEKRMDLSRCLEVDSQAQDVVIAIHEIYDSYLPEVARLISDPYLYAKTIKRVLMKHDLDDLLPRQTALAIKISLGDNSLHKLDVSASTLESIETVISLENEKQTIMQHHISLLPDQAPNLLEILQPDTIVQLLAWKGSLLTLASTPPANLGAIGKRQNGGIGVLEMDKIIQQVPLQFHRQAIRIVASKTVMAARVDVSHSQTNGSQGRKWRRNIEDRLDHLMAPPPSLQTRALPIPIDKPSKRRGGRKVRRVKQRNALTDLHKESNKIAFAGGSSVGAGSSNPSGSIRKTQAQPRRGFGLSKAMKERLQKSLN